ncbi:unnamed protein product [Miscanthus lutarioriparius]|uniref:Major facilitator superfamily (MFS) profile domain-containing protein n=1 Tax=Miscanthus lutarioriparius TaxID=422564 RepID=A0A811NPZ2_9POAL|nr:unnamed protein product [Miscanthus lutarioriparius]
MAMRHRARSSPTSPLTPSSSTRSKKILGFSVSLILINLASIMERADENLLPAVYKEVSAAFNAGPTDLGYLTFAMNFLKSIASPLAGAVGASQHFRQVAFWRAVNGLGLAIVIPALQSFIADSYKDGTRGAGFGLLSLIGAVGGIGGSILATIMAGKDYWGFPGWRVAFMMVALVSLIIGILVYLYATDPRRIPGNRLLDEDDYERLHLSSKDVLPPPSIWRILGWQQDLL